jgi:hypothetical protein
MASFNLFLGTLTSLEVNNFSITQLTVKYCLFFTNSPQFLFNLSCDTIPLECARKRAGWQSSVPVGALALRIAAEL